MRSRRRTNVGGLTDQLREFLDAHRVVALATASKEEASAVGESTWSGKRDANRLLISTMSERLEDEDVQRRRSGDVAGPRG